MWVLLVAPWPTAQSCASTLPGGCTESSLGSHHPEPVSAATDQGIGWTKTGLEEGWVSSISPVSEALPREDPNDNGKL